MPTIRITEKQDAYITADVEVSDAEYADLAAAHARNDVAFILAWNDRVQAEDSLDWSSADCGETFETVSIDVVGDDLAIDTLWEL